jgi:hypoxanthine phosphoribosyltransferase
VSIAGAPAGGAGKVVVSEQQLAARVTALGRALARYYRGDRPVFLGVMNGALCFLADLVRATPLDLEVTTVRLASYRGAVSTGHVRGLGALQGSVRGRRVLIVDDILDTGRTLAALSARLRELGAAEVRSCVLLEKKVARAVAIQADWVGFRIPDRFVVGYGLDYNGRHRALREVRLFNPEG